jgi:hypothetical protein
VGAGIEFVVIGGVAVGAHGVVRGTKDLDICPSPDPANLALLATLLRDLGAHQVGVGEDDFAEDEMPLDPKRAEDLAAGGNFRLETPLGTLDLMQWIPGLDADAAYAELVANAARASAFGVQIMVCSLEDLRRMKRAAGRPQDLQDLVDLDAAHPQSTGA